jgi:hypothetical protein
MTEEQEFFIRMAEHNLPVPPKDSTHPVLLDLALCFSACRWGSGECGPLLLEHLLLTLADSMEKPRYIILIDAAVFLVTENTLLECEAAWQKLEEAGVRILVSEASARHYGQISCIRRGAVVKFQEISKVLLSIGRFVNL